MMGSMAIAACVSHHASACCFGVSFEKLSASSCRNAVVPTRPAMELLSPVAAVLAPPHDISASATVNAGTAQVRVGIKEKPPPAFCHGCGRVSFGMRRLGTLTTLERDYET